jgi:hypothetical protein
MIGIAWRMRMPIEGVLFCFSLGRFITFPLLTKIPVILKAQITFFLWWRAPQQKYYCQLKVKCIWRARDTWPNSGLHEAWSWIARTTAATVQLCCTRKNRASASVDAYFRQLAVLGAGHLHKVGPNDAASSQGWGRNAKHQGVQRRNIPDKEMKIKTQIL